MYNLGDKKKEKIYNTIDTKREVKAKLSHLQALKLAQEYHDKYKIDGMIDSNANDTIFLKEKYYGFEGLTWYIKSKLKPNTFEGMECFFIVVSDSEGCAVHALDHTGGVIEVH